MRHEAIGGRLMLLLAGLQLGACLPEDTRAVPGKLRVEVRGSEAASALTTADGYSVRFESFLVTLGYSRLEGDYCNTYSTPEYNRIFDASRLEARKVNELYALGRCLFGYRVDGPSSDTLLDEGVSEDDKARMRVSDKSALGDGSVAIEVVGSADNGTNHKRFSWSFREIVWYDGCFITRGETDEPLFELDSTTNMTLVLTLHADALFAQSPFDPTAELLFEPFAKADDETGDGNGEITPSELELAEPPAEPTPPDEVDSLADLMRIVRFPAIIRLAEFEACERVSLAPPWQPDVD